MEDWMQLSKVCKEYPIFREGLIVAYTKISPESEALRLRFGIEAWVNTTASEPRWEATAEGIQAILFGSDPNAVIAECARRVEFSALRISRPAPPKVLPWWKRLWN
jgi:hypothetical protein